MSKPAKPVTTGPLLPIEQHLRDHIAHIKETDPAKGASLSTSFSLTLPKIESDAELGADHRRKQSEKARKPRGKIADTGETLSTVIEKLARRKDALDYPRASELWPEFIGKLDRLLLEPEEITHPTDPRKSIIEYDAGEKRRRITFGRFESAVSETRKKSR